MGDSTEQSAEPTRLVLQFGESVEVDGSTVFDPVSERPAAAVVLRMPPHRAAWFAQLLGAYTQVCRLVGARMDALKAGPAWALSLAAAAGYVEPGTIRRRSSPRRQLRTAEILRRGKDLDEATVHAVIEAAARWLEEPAGDEYAWALLGAVTDGPTEQRAFSELLDRVARTFLLTARPPDDPAVRALVAEHGAPQTAELVAATSGTASEADATEAAARGTERASAVDHSGRRGVAVGIAHVAAGLAIRVLLGPRHSESSIPRIAWRAGPSRTVLIARVAAAESRLEAAASGEDRARAARGADLRAELLRGDQPQIQVIVTHP
jgi:hypothetical protein